MDFDVVQVVVVVVVAVLVDDPNRLDARHGVRVVGEGELDGGGSDCAEGEGEVAADGNKHQLNLRAEVDSLSSTCGRANVADDSKRSEWRFFVVDTDLIDARS